MQANENINKLKDLKDISVIYNFLFNISQGLKELHILMSKT